MGGRTCGALGPGLYSPFLGTHPGRLALATAAAGAAAGAAGAAGASGAAGAEARRAFPGTASALLLPRGAPPPSSGARASPVPWAGGGATHPLSRGGSAATAVTELGGSGRDVDAPSLLRAPSPATGAALLW